MAEKNSFEREIDFKKLPKSEINNSEEKNFRERAVPFLKDVKENPRAREIAKENGVYVGDPLWHNILLVFFIFGIIGGIGWLGYLGYTDHFKSDINLDCADVNLTCPVIPNCPACNPSLVCPDFPKDLSLKVENYYNMTNSS